MTPQELKNSVLQLAIQGKLVEQRPEEGTGAELLREISTQRRRDAEAAKKESRAKSAKSAKESRLASNVSRPVEDAPFEIPESWVWVRLGEVAAIERGSGIKRSETSPTGFPCIRYGEIYTTYGVSFTETKSFVPESLAHSCHKANCGDVLCTLTGEWKEEIAKATAYLGSKPIAIGGDLAKITTQAFEPTLLVFFFFSPFLIQQKALKANGDMIVHIGKEAVCNLLIPLPPLAEQKRIVAKIEELLPLVDRYEKAWSRLEEFNRRFPEDMRKSVLQMAIQGKLVEQRLEEGTAEELYRQIQAEKQALIKAGKIKKEKPLPEIAADEIPFEIPKSWKWVRLGLISSQITDGEHKTPHRVSSFCGYYLLSARNVTNGAIKLDHVDYVDEKEYEIISKRCNPKRNDVLISCSGSIGRCCVVEDDNKYVMVRSAAMVSLIKIDPKWIMYCIHSNALQKQISDKAKATAQANLFQEPIKRLIIPIPPLAEQKRIVSKLEKLLPLCERLK